MTSKYHVAGVTCNNYKEAVIDNFLKLNKHFKTELGSYTIPKTRLIANIIMLTVAINTVQL
ncbi:hypothetical protein OS188_01540 [Xanthomarina sp. F1114]|uniref:hypothetical protein n=1 Tax=Xanthomarina sp. F1114 TaxID=2996019 RepID=UPI00225E37EB|nr:hypothetical protein [Xanthomarina sp. F1114]MCX7546629.1 hypothetical protein [Xanthomarina sp. F1114]